MSLACLPTSFESSSGEILLAAAATGGTAPYTYAWSATMASNLCFPVPWEGEWAQWCAPVQSFTWVAATGVTFSGATQPNPDVSIVDGGLYTFTVTVTDSTNATITGSVTREYRRSYNYFRTNAAADAAASTLPASIIPAYLAITDPVAKAAITLRASRDIDNQRYQGARYDLVWQKLEFPRMARIPSTRSSPTAYGYPGGAVPSGAIWGETVWDIDPRTNVAIVPRDVYAAVIYQANYVAAGGSDRINNQYQGVQDDMTGGLRETYDSSAPGVRTGLCQDAYRLLKKYKLVTGRLL